MNGLYLRNFDAEGDLADLPGRSDGKSGRVAYSAAELDRLLTEARTVGYAEGRTAGMAAASEQAQVVAAERAATAVEKIAEGVDEFRQNESDRQHAGEMALVELSLAVGERVFPELLEQLSPEIIAARIEAGLQLASVASKITIVVSPATEQAVLRGNNRLRRLQDRHLNVEIVTDEYMNDSAARVEWAEGCLDFDLDGACREILNVMRDTARKMKETTGGQDR